MAGTPADSREWGCVNLTSTFKALSSVTTEMCARGNEIHLLILQFNSERFDLN